MQRHHIEDVVLYHFLIGEAPGKRLHERHAFHLMFVGVNASVLLFGRNYLSEIMSQSQKHEPVRFRYAVSEFCSSVYYLHSVCPDITLRMEDRVLLKADSLLQLRKPHIELVHGAQ